MIVILAAFDYTAKALSAPPIHDSGNMTVILATFTQMRNYDRHCCHSSHRQGRMIV